MQVFLLYLFFNRSRYTQLVYKIKVSSHNVAVTATAIIASSRLYCLESSHDGAVTNDKDFFSKWVAWISLKNSCRMNEPSHFLSRRIKFEFELIFPLFSIHLVQNKQLQSSKTGRSIEPSYLVPWQA